MVVQSVQMKAFCGTYDPAIITGTLPTGGAGGTILYAWEEKVGAGAWTPIVGANTPTYDPGAITTTTQYRRRASIQGCSNSIYSNIVTKTVKALPNTNAGTDKTICVGVSTTLTASGAGTGWYLYMEYRCNNGCYHCFAYRYY